TASVVVTIDSSSMVVGSATQAHAVAKDSKGNVLSGKTATWLSMNSTVASTSSSGLATGKAAGTASIQATIDGVNGAASLTVTSPPSPPPPTQSGLPAEPFFDATTGSMIFQTNFDNYTASMLFPTCGSAQPSQQVIDHAWLYCTTPGVGPEVSIVPGHS